MTKDEILLAQKEYLFPAVFHYFAEPLVISHAKHQYVWDVEGKQYLDFFGGIVTISVGHCNDQVDAAVQAQSSKLQHVSTVLVNEPQVRLAQKIAAITPGGLRKSFFTNSGTEANETAILAARCATGSSEVIALRYSYHGRSAMGMAMSGIGTWRLGGTAPAGFVFAHNAYCYRCPFGLTYPSCDVRCARDVEPLIKTATSGRIAAFIAEPIQGVAGYITPPPEYFRIIEEIVRRHGGLFIADEVQTGWGRTGDKWFGIEQSGVQPDILTSAKGMGNGAPIGLTVARPEVADALQGVTLSTFGGNPVATTAARAVIEFIEAEDLRTNATTTGGYLRARLEELQGKHALIGEVRGMGLMQAMELVRDRHTKEPATRETLAVMEAARERGVLVGKGGIAGNVLRCTPPLNIGRADVDHFIAVLDECLATV
ncbi:MAG: aspartate aminotransferase family protein [Bryobacteraceae bacterium]|nr:aspartate aminotransferase family protein [Bryobacteraceae bacterium]